MTTVTGRPHGVSSYDGGSALIQQMIDIAEAQQKAAGLCRQLGLAPGATFDVMSGVADVSQELVRCCGRCMLSLHGLTGEGRKCLLLITDYWPKGSCSCTEERLAKLLNRMDEVAVFSGEHSRLVALKWDSRCGPKRVPCRRAWGPAAAREPANGRVELV